MAETPEIIFYDGHCGFCHRFVRYVALKDHAGLFHFSTRETKVFTERVPAEVRTTLPPSVVVLRNDGKVLLRSDATIHILTRMGGSDAKWAAIMKLFPRVLRDTGYRCIATIRRHIFAEPKDVCPVVPEELRSRFLL